MFFIERQILYLKQLSHCPCNFMNISSEEFFSLGGIIFCCSVTKSYPTLCNPAFQASLSFTISQSLLKLMFITSVMPSNHLILYCPLLLLPQFSQHQGLFQWVGSLHQMARVLELQHQSFQWIQGWFPLGLTGLISLLFKVLSRVFSSTTVWKHQFFIAQPSLWSNSHIYTWLLEKP